MRAFGLAAAAILLTQAGNASAQSAMPEGMTIHLQVKDEISSKKAKKGDPVNFVVSQPVVIGGETLIPSGTPVVGQVMRARDNGLFGRSGKLEISVSQIDAGGRQIPVRGDQNKKGRSGTVGVVGAAVLFLPLGILVRGGEATLKAGTPVDVYVAREVQIETAAAPAASSPSPEPSPAPEKLTTIQLPPSAAAETSSPAPAPAPVPP